MKLPRRAERKAATGASLIMLVHLVTWAGSLLPSERMMRQQETKIKFKKFYKTGIMTLELFVSNFF